MSNEVLVDDAAQAAERDAKPAPRRRVKTKMRHGYVAMIDALGWKNIWKRYPQREQEILRTVTQMGKAIREVNRKHTPGDVYRTRPRDGTTTVPSGPVGTMYAKSVFLSDTLVIGVWSPEVNEDMDEVQRLWISASVAQVLRIAALATIPLTFRGSIARGDFLISKTSILGPAIDRAAVLMERADVAAVWFAPDIPDARPSDRLCFPYPLPLRDGRTISAQVICPFSFCNGAEARRAMDNMLSSFDVQDLDVAIKRQNTAGLLKVAYDRWLRLVFEEIKKDPEKSAKFADALGPRLSAKLGVGA